MDPRKYARALRAVKFSDQSTLNNFGMTTADWIGGSHPHADQTKRGAFADAYEEHTGDTEGANLLRDPRLPVHWDGNQLRLGVLKEKRIHSGSSDYNGGREINFQIQNEGPESVAQRLIAQHGRTEGYLTNPNPRERGHYIENGHFAGDHLLTWNPEQEAYALYQYHVLPREHGLHTIMEPNGTTREMRL